MAEEKFTQEDGIDDLSALQTLLETVRGIRVVSTPPTLEIPPESPGDFNS